MKESELEREKVEGGESKERRVVVVAGRQAASGNPDGTNSHTRGSPLADKGGGHSEGSERAFGGNFRTEACRKGDRAASRSRSCEESCS